MSNSAEGAVREKVYDGELAASTPDGLTIHLTQHELNLIEAVLRFCDDGHFLAASGKTTLRRKLVAARLSTNQLVH